ncbi:hypothetical protein NFI95_05835 [Acetobacteraceae bacterium KSS8]|uniref:Morphogenetic protein n=1 Tax=Endosaccharibacter trunci TaxID=2812733 RepID=A0ABT1W6D1_9PROT|nr:hypothetical protein [Acetobacteraceae bacterium KSS8]
MIKALLASTKTQTRRVMRVQPPTRIRFPHSDFGLSRSVADGIKMYSQNDHPRLPKHPTDWDLVGSVGVARDAGFPMRYRCPFGQPGDLLWVREAHGIIDNREYGGTLSAEYHADTDAARPGGWENEPDSPDALRWRPSIHMPRWASRLTLRITDVRAQLLQDISEEDARAEGIGDGGCLSCGMPEPCGCPSPLPSVRDGFAWLWNNLRGPDAWSANPWVWALTFETLHANVVSLEGSRA